MNSMDLTTPVTRGELREELAVVRAEISELDAKQGGMEQRLGADLARHGGALQEAMRTEIAVSQKAMRTEIAGVEQRLGADLARHAGALREAMKSEFAAFDERYSPLLGARRANDSARQATSTSPRPKRRKPKPH